MVGAFSGSAGLVGGFGHLNLFTVQVMHPQRPLQTAAGSSQRQCQEQGSEIEESRRPGPVGACVTLESALKGDRSPSGSQDMRREGVRKGGACGCMGLAWGHKLAIWGIGRDGESGPGG